MMDENVATMKAAWRGLHNHLQDFFSSMFFFAKQMYENSRSPFCYTKPVHGAHFLTIVPIHACTVMLKDRHYAAAKCTTNTASFTTHPLITLFNRSGLIQCSFESIQI